MVTVNKVEGEIWGDPRTPFRPALTLAQRTDTKTISILPHWPQLETIIVLVEQIDLSQDSVCKFPK